MTHAVPQVIDHFGGVPNLAKLLELHCGDGIRNMEKDMRERLGLGVLKRR